MRKHKREKWKRVFPGRWNHAPWPRSSIKLSCGQGNNSVQPSHHYDSFPFSIPSISKEHRALSVEPNIPPTLFPLELTTTDLSSRTAMSKFWKAWTWLGGKQRDITFTNVLTEFSPLFKTHPAPPVPCRSCSYLHIRKRRGVPTAQGQGTALAWLYVLKKTIQPQIQLRYFWSFIYEVWNPVETWLLLHSNHYPY